MPDAEAKLSDFDYDLPPDLIAQAPAVPRDASRLLVLDRGADRLEHRRFRDLPDLLRAGDLLVLNDTRVIPAAFTARRASGSRIEGCFLRVVEEGPQEKATPPSPCPLPQGEREQRNTWEVLLAGRGRIRAGETLHLLNPAGEPADAIELVGRGEGGSWIVRGQPGADAIEVLGRLGRTPLPPYIRREAGDPRSSGDPQTYQTIYARQDGAVAAPTAGLHFTEDVFDRLQRQGVERTTLTLHVGLGTFQPIRTERLAEHRMHAEHFEISAEAAARVNRARAEGRRVIAVGTTTVRALESAATDDGALRAAREATRIFIYPPYRFRIVGGLITNFHLPRTTLLAMVCAMAGRDRVLAAYEEAGREGYRFYSYGDAMLIV